MGTFSESFEYDVKRTILKMYEKMFDYKLELLQSEKCDKKKNGFKNWTRYLVPQIGT